MIWDEITDKQGVKDLVLFEKSIYDEEDLTTPAEYNEWRESRNLRIFLLRDKYKNIMGSYQVFNDNGKCFMSGFAIAKQHRETHIADTLMRNLIHTFGGKEIICKTGPKNIQMRNVLKRNGWENKLDKFENGVLWLWWSYNKGNIHLKKKMKKVAPK